MISLYLIQGNHHEVSLSHQRMGDLQVRLIHRQIIVEQDVDVNRTIGIAAGGTRFGLSSQLTLDGLRQPQHLVRALLRQTKDGPVKETVRGGEAPRGGLYERGAADDLPYPLLYQPYGLFHSRFTVAEIASQSQIDRMPPVRLLHRRHILSVIDNQQGVTVAAELILILHSQLIALIDEVIATKRGLCHHHG